jgi:hypothetical protein
VERLPAEPGGCFGDRLGKWKIVIGIEGMTSIGRSLRWSEGGRKVLPRSNGFFGSRWITPCGTVDRTAHRLLRWLEGGEKHRQVAGSEGNFGIGDPGVLRNGNQSCRELEWLAAVGNGDGGGREVERCSVVTNGCFGDREELRGTVFRI